MTVQDLIIQELQENTEPDPHVLAKELLPRLTAEMRREMLLPALVLLIREKNRYARKDSFGPRVGPSRRSQAINEFNVRYLAAGGVWKLYGECDADDLDEIASTYADEAARSRAKAERFYREAKELRKSGFRTVKEWKATT